MTVVTRDQWNALDPKPNCIAERNTDAITTAVVHHSDEPPPSDPHSAHDEGHDAAAGQVRSIQAFHMNTRGWCDIAYHWLIAPDGAVYEGRAINQIGAHAAGFNMPSIGYCLLTVDDVTQEQKAALVGAIAADEERLGRHLELKGHRDVSATDCPGDAIEAWVNAGLPLDDPGPAPAPVPEPNRCADLPPGPAPAGHSTLQVGDRGPEVAELQDRLASANFIPAGSRKGDGTWDGIFGMGTRSAVLELQGLAGVERDGIVGRQTWCSLGVR